MIAGEINNDEITKKNWCLCSMQCKMNMARDIIQLNANFNAWKKKKKNIQQGGKIGYI